MDAAFEKNAIQKERLVPPKFIAHVASSPWYSSIDC
jgi:hypothetical protein